MPLPVEVTPDAATEPRVIALVIGDVEGAAGPYPPLLARAVDALRRLEGVAEVLAAVPAGQDAGTGGAARGIGAGLDAAIVTAVRDAGPEGVVLLHDPCRCPVDARTFGRALDHLRESGADGVVAAAPVTDTLKRVGPGGRIAETVDRSAMWEIRTPQVYRARALTGALARSSGGSAEGAIRAGDHGLLPSLVDGVVRILALPRESLRIEHPDDAELAGSALALEP
jgi:2-C-methyl-D-erythritol 4-phosphate cytidylyltransferase